VQFPQAAAHPAVARMCLMHRYVGGGGACRVTWVWVLWRQRAFVLVGFLP
jgi:hypothetical protein